MPADADQELLRRYAHQRDEQAFAELVHRHVNLVWAAARRVTGNSELARDVAQTVFTDLARKAGSLPPETVLAGWLHCASCHAAAKQVRGEVRRARREQLSMITQTTDASDTADARAAGELQPLLDAALAELPAADRDAVVLRFLAGRSLAQVGEALGTGEDAAQKRVSRALEKLRETFRRRGLEVGGGVVAAALSVAGTQAAPLGLAGSLSTAALTAAATAGGAAPFLLLMKSKLILGVAGITALAVLGWQHLRVKQLVRDNEVLRHQLAAGKTSPAAAATSPAESAAMARLREQQDELLRLRGEVAQLRQAARSAVTRAAAAPSAGAGDIDALTTQALIAEATSARIVNALKQLGLAAISFAYCRPDQKRGLFPTSFEQMSKEVESLARSGPDGTVGGVSLELLEFHPHERTVDPSERQMILIREKAPRHLPNGTWERIYCLFDGSVQRINRDNGDFDDFELERTATAANAPQPE